ncbi:hypothetical protein [Sulfobacillus harzensis]|uniref:hypothetical protein n=1 Tax=Sulfobacillus harzensis TaxID=2729629 RepID=UPI001FAC512C|nr:hypothetical protein [Sulfobacillus harzensis]
MIWIDVSYVLYVVTFLTGMLFFVRFDARRRPLRRRLIGMHLIMAVATFIMITSIMAVNAFPSHALPPPVNPKNSTMWDYVFQHRSELSRHHHGQGVLP